MCACFNTLSGSKKKVNRKTEVAAGNMYGMGCKVELSNIICVAAGQKYVAAKNKHSCVRIVNRTHGASGL